MNIDKYNKLLDEFLDALDNNINILSTRFRKLIVESDAPPDALTKITIELAISPHMPIKYEVETESSGYLFEGNGLGNYRVVGLGDLILSHADNRGKSDPIDFSHKNYWEPIDITKEGPMFNSLTPEEGSD